MPSLVHMQQGNVKKFKKLMKIVSIGGGNLHIFRTTREISMRYSGKMCFKILIVTKRVFRINAIL